MLCDETPISPSTLGCQGFRVTNTFTCHQGGPLQSTGTEGQKPCTQDSSRHYPVPFLISLFPVSCYHPSGKLVDVSVSLKSVGHPSKLITPGQGCGHPNLRQVRQESQPGSSTWCLSGDLTLPPGRQCWNCIELRTPSWCPRRNPRTAVTHTPVTWLFFPQLSTWECESAVALVTGSSVFTNRPSH
jgi:hypothetical protein